MQLPTIKQLVLGPPDRMAKFVCYRDKELWYSAVWTDDNGVDKFFEFPVPIEDAEGATFLDQDKPSIFRRWMRKHIDFLADAFKAAQEQT